MPIFLDTRGNSTLGIGLCARCSKKYPLGKLRPDPNAPGLLCCDEGCLDRYDPWRLPARPPDKIALRFARPDVPLDSVPEFDPIRGD